MVNKTVFVLLAGGKSERMGVAKGLLKYHQTFWILEQLNRISKSNISDVYIGLGYDFKNYFDDIPWFKDAITKPIKYLGLNVAIVINKNPELGSFSTLQTVLKNIDFTVDTIICPIDVPILNSEELNKLIEVKNTLVIPTYKDKNGHPIKINNDLKKQLEIVNLSDKNARLDYQLKKINDLNISKISVNDNAVLKNLNTKIVWKTFISKNT